MPPRIGKVKIYTEEGRLIREGQIREQDLAEQKIFKIFTPSELIKAVILVVGFSFTAGGAWFSINEHFQTTEGEFKTFVDSFTQFKTDDAVFHKSIFLKLDGKDERINCLAQKLSSCCPNNNTQC